MQAFCYPPYGAANVPANRQMEPIQKQHHPAAVSLIDHRIRFTFSKNALQSNNRFNLGQMSHFQTMLGFDTWLQAST